MSRTAAQRGQAVAKASGPGGGAGKRVWSGEKELDTHAIAVAGVHVGDSKIDRTWDDLVESFPGGELAQTTLWAATRQRTGIRVCHVVLYAADGSTLGGCLIQYRRILPGVHIGGVPRGPLLFVDDAGLAGQLVTEMTSAARRAGIFLLVVQPPDGVGDSLQVALRNAGFRPGGPPLAPDATIRIDLQRPEEEILRSVHARKRTNIRNAMRAMRNGLDCRESIDIETFHRLHVASAKRLGFPPISIASLKAEWEILAPKGMCHLIEIRYADAPIGGEWLTCFGDIVQCKLRGQDSSGMPECAATKLAGTASLWAAIVWARSIGARYFDFNGFDRHAAEAVLSGGPLPRNIHSSSQIKWTFGGTVLLLPQSHFVLTNWLVQRLVGGLLMPLLTGRAARRLAQRIRTRRSGGLQSRT